MTQRSAQGDPSVEKRPVKEPPVEKPSVEKPSVEKPSVEKPSGEKLSGEKLSGEKLSGEKDVTLDIRQSMEQLKRRHPRVRWQVMEPGQLHRFLTKLGYEGPFDRCKYDAIYFQEEGREKVMVVWGLVE